MASGVNIVMDLLTRLLYGTKAPVAVKLIPTRTVFSSPLPTTSATNELAQPLLSTGPAVPPVMILFLLICFLAGFLYYQWNINTISNEPRTTSQRFVACLDYISDCLKDTSECIANGTSTISALANSVNQLNEQFRGYRLKVDTCLDYISDRLKDMSERITNGTSTVIALANLVKQLKKQFRELRLEVEAEFKRYDLEAIAHKHKIKLLNDNNKKLSDQIVELTRSNTTEQDSLRQKVRKLERIGDNKTKKITELEDDNKFLKKQADEFTSLNDKYLGQMHEGRTRAALLQKELEELTFKQDTTAGASLFGRALGNPAKPPVQPKKLPVQPNFKQDTTAGASLFGGVLGNPSKLPVRPKKLPVQLNFNQDTNAGASLFGGALGNSAKLPVQNTNATGKCAADATNTTDKKTEADDGTKSSDAENPKAARNKRRNQRRREQEKGLRAEKARERAAKLAEEAAAKAAEEEEEKKKED